MSDDFLDKVYGDDFDFLCGNGIFQGLIDKINIHRLSHQQGAGIDSQESTFKFTDIAFDIGGNK
jgi:hypothetical protein